MSAAGAPSEASLIGHLTQQGRRRLVVVAALRTIATVALLLVLYFLLPLGGGTSVEKVIKLTVGALALHRDHHLAGSPDYPIQSSGRSGSRGAGVQRPTLCVASRSDIFCDGSHESGSVRGTSQSYRRAVLLFYRVHHCRVR